MTTRPPRRGFTLVEVIVVMAILILLAIIVLPSLGAFRGDTRSRAAGDVIRGELAVARARAKDEGKPYRVALSPDGRRLRRAPDAADFAQAPASDQPTWVEVHSTHFTVITDAGEKRGKEVALRFEQMRAVFAILLTKDRLNQPLPLTTTTSPSAQLAEFGKIKNATG